MGLEGGCLARAHGIRGRARWVSNLRDGRSSAVDVTVGVMDVMVGVMGAC
jgi:hypothetical protein